jgi:uncharacterized membrane protein YdjX (TVP38/TMEM64 family)
MEDLKKDISYVNDETQKAIANEVKLMKVELIENTSFYFASIFSRMLLLVFALITLVFLLLALGLFLQQFTGSLYISFGLVSAGLLLFLLIGALFRKTLLAGPVQDAVIRELAPKLFKS